MGTIGSSKGTELSNSIFLQCIQIFSPASTLYSDFCISPQELSEFWGTLNLIWRKTDQKGKNILLSFAPRKTCAYNYRFSTRLGAAGCVMLIIIAVSWICNDSSAGFFHIHDIYWHQMQLYKSSAAKLCFANPQAVHLLLITTIIYIELESFTSRLRPS